MSIGSHSACHQMSDISFTPCSSQIITPCPPWHGTICSTLCNTSSQI